MTTETFSPTRYPFTYAADYLRDNPHVIPTDVADAYWGWELPPVLMSRSQAAQIRERWAATVGVDSKVLARAWADQYLTDHGIEKPEES